MAILGVTDAYTQKHKKTGHIITTNIEHHAVLHTCIHLEQRGWKVTYLEADTLGNITTQQVKDAIEEDTVLVSIMYANNEIGTILPIADIGRTILSYRKKEESIYPYFHTDACQATSSEELHVE